MAIKLKKRSFDVLRVPWQKNWADGFQIVNYEAGQFYNTHTDFFGLGTTRDWNWDPSSGGINRFATVFVYLSDAELGGETMFPLAGKIPDHCPYFLGNYGPTVLSAAGVFVDIGVSSHTMRDLYHET